MINRIMEVLVGRERDWGIDVKGDKNGFDWQRSWAKLLSQRVKYEKGQMNERNKMEF